MLSVDDVARFATALPGVVEGTRFGNRTWFAGDKGQGFVWERPFSKADLKRFGDVTPPDGEIIAIRVADLAEREAVLATNVRGFFTIEHFQGYPAFLVQLNQVAVSALREALVDGWLACAPATLASEYAGPAGVRALSARLPRLRPGRPGSPPA